METSTPQNILMECVYLEKNNQKPKNYMQLQGATLYIKKRLECVLYKKNC